MSTYIPFEEGYGKYAGAVRTSFYVAGSEGTKLAVDLYLPAGSDCEPIGEPLPLVLHAGKGGRRMGEGVDAITAKLVANGYAHMFLETRGSGVSHGFSKSFCDPQDGRDVAAVIEWAAVQPWCNGKVGMRGISNSGLIQEATAPFTPEHLVAIAPVVCNSDFYYQNHPNGVSAVPGGFMTMRGAFRPQIGAPVDNDPAPGYPQAHEALRQQKDNKPFIGYTFYANMCRDTVHPELGYAPYLELPPVEYTDAIRAKGYKIYQFGGWFDSGAAGQLITYKNWGGKITIGPWNHGESGAGESKLPGGNMDLPSEYLRWFDYALKEIDNGFDREPRVKYFTINAPKGREWRTSPDWPPAASVPTAFYLGGKGANLSGALTSGKPAEDTEAYRVDLTPEIFGMMGRMDSLILGDMTEKLDRKGLSFATEPLEADTEMTGHGVGELWVSSTAADGNFILVVEDVAPNGESRYVTLGVCRASHRKTEPNAAFDSLGLPYHRSLIADLMPMEPGVPVKLEFAIDAISYLFGAGHRIRATLVCAEEKTYQQPEGFDRANLPVVTLYTGGDKASRVFLPIMKG